MMYTIKFVAGVVGDLAALRPYDRRRVLDRIDAELGDAPIAATRNPQPQAAPRPTASLGSGTSDLGIACLQVPRVL
jgi:hypothetical protein